jgi:methyl-accepting chemotaxis protein
MSIVGFFLPKSPGGSAAMRRRFPYLVGMDLLLLLYFPLSALLRYRSNPALYRAFFLSICGSESLFIISLLALKAGSCRASSYLGSLGILLNVVLMAFLTPFTAWSDIYKLGVYLLGAVLANALISLERRQVLVYMGAGFAVYGSIILLVALPRLGALRGEGASTSLLFLLLFLAFNTAALLITDLNARLVEEAEAEGAENRRRAEGLSLLIGSVSGALETGRELVAAAAEGRSRSSEIRSRLSALCREAEALEAEASTVDEKSAAALGRVEAAQSAVDGQNVVIVDAGAAVERIGHTLRETANMAESRRGAIADVAALAERQGGELRELLHGIEKIVASSGAVTLATGGILDVSEKTQLLAMNASIEAAHAGSSGKGFAVIAGEIRKLSRETQDSTLLIDQAIKANAATVREQESAIGRFTEGIGRMTADVRSTFEALGTMMEGIARMESATDNLSEATGSLLRLAGETKASVGGVGEGLRSGAASAESAKHFAAGLSAEIAGILEAFASMDEAIEKAASIGECNLSRVGELDAGIAAIEREVVCRKPQ